MSACPLSSTRPNQRFTPEGGEALEEHLERTCSRVLHAVRALIPPAKLEAVYLGGGYGRGEGGVLVTERGERPYNDLEFYVFAGGNRHLNEWRHARALDVLGEILTPSAGAHVEFKIASGREFERQPISMFSYDLVSAHRVLFGSDYYFQRCSHHCHAPKIPLAEATRLLMNRCSGLLFARELLENAAFTPADADFVSRNIAKAQLALGDAVLTVFHRYHWSCKERHRRLKHDLALANAPAWREEILRLHVDGVRFKLHPTCSTESRDQLRARWEQLLPHALQVWLWVEEQRLGLPFANARHYALEMHAKDSAGGSPRKLAAQLWQNGARGLLSGQPLRSPRERLLRSLTLLLWEPEALTHPRLVMRLQRELHSDAVALPAFVRAYREIWRRAN
ncbi:MAG: hypothetical protein C0518_02055 [Opitutus sp.]|nr:hypothetical protein [Opitutus sp.]